MSLPTPGQDLELIILGGGCAGLSLGARLAQSSFEGRVAIVEPRGHYVEDRTWCGWRLNPHPFEDCLVSAWNRWRIVTPTDVVERGSTRYPYEMIRSDRFYAGACRAIEASARVSLRRNSSAIDVTETKDAVQVELQDGTVLRAAYVVDTRPLPQTLSHPWLWQNFVGFVVALPRGTPHGFAEIPTLMDFQPAGECVCQFMYVIPAGEGRFLFEWTQFSREHGNLPEIERSLCQWLSVHLRSGWNLERRESGCLPMSLPEKSSSRRIIEAGTRGGSMRASTGYAFHSIQRWADLCATALAGTGVPIPPRPAPLLEAMDLLFLHVLQQPSASAAEIFGTLFRSAPADALVRFLAGEPKRSDLWPVVRDLPWTRFLRALPAAARTWSAP